LFFQELYTLFTVKLVIKKRSLSGFSTNHISNPFCNESVMEMCQMSKMDYLLLRSSFDGDINTDKMELTQ